MSLFETIQSDMYAAMKAGEKENVTTLRSAIAKLKDKKIDKRDDLTKEEEIKILQSLVKQRKESIELYIKGGREELAEKEALEITVYEKYLPSMISQDEVRIMVARIIKEVGATSMADMRKIMPLLMKEGAGRVDGKLAQQLVSELLG
ncbi:MAG: GatB/YqeY domain-containing protein [Candidatus Marinimicrobia bacterium]|nr:GatB/YqeY domain-containing protein [Candidatus Neomarinimicrobiota bacterium]